MKWIDSLLGVHRNESAWIFGTRSNLDQFDISRTGPLRICIDEAVLFVPGPSYFFSRDNLAIVRAADKWPSNCRAVLEPDRAALAAANGVPDAKIYRYLNRTQREILDWNPPRISEENSLYGQSGSVDSAIHFCRMIGVAAITLVGCGSEAAPPSGSTSVTPPGGAQRGGMSRQAEVLLERLAIPYRFAG
ncbi:MAG: hypothetical protein WDZ59_05150 [Pirellulales bacterium]